MLTVFMTGIIVLCAVLLAVYFKKYRGLPQTDFRPPVLWIRAGIYFCACLIVSWATGTMEKTLANPFVTQEQLHSSAWIIFTAVCFVVGVVCYWIIWAGMTITFKRKRYPAVQVCFGLVWGMCTAQLFLVMWNFSAIFDWPLWGRWLLGYVLVGAYMGLWQDLYWDVYVIPEHDTPRSLRLKVVCSHIPYMTLCLTHLAIYDNQWIFSLLFTLALTGASVFLRFPPWWETIDVVAPRTTPGLFGLPHAAGYIGEEQSPPQAAKSSGPWPER